MVEKGSWLIHKIQDAANPTRTKTTLDNLTSARFDATGSTQTHLTDGIISQDTTKLTRRQIQEEMYSQGYRKLAKRSEIEALPGSFTINTDELEELDTQGTMIFTQVFPEEGQNNLVVIKKDPEHNTLYIHNFASKKDAQKRSDDIIAGRQNKAASKSKIAVIAEADRRGEDLVIETAEANARIKMRAMLGLTQAA